MIYPSATVDLLSSSSLSLSSTRCHSGYRYGSEFVLLLSCYEKVIVVDYMRSSQSRILAYYLFPFF